MGTYSVQVPTFLGGISQQSAAIRRENLVEAATNVEFMATEGTIKRYPTRWIKSIGADLGGYRGIPLERDDSKYVIAVGDGDIVAYETDGTEVHVEAADFNYLNGAAFEDIRYQIFADTIFVLNRQKVVAATAGKAGPSWAAAGEAGLFIKQSNYGVTYSIEIQTTAMGSPVTVQYRTPAETFVQKNFRAGSEFVLTANQAAGVDPIVFTPNWNGPYDLSFMQNPSTSGVGTTPPSGGTLLDSADFEADPFTNEIYYIGSSLIAGDTLAIWIPEDVTISYFLEPAIIRRELQARLQAASIPGLSFETDTINDSSLRLYTTAALTKFEVRDSQANTYAVGWTTQVEEISDLPLVFKHGAVVKIVGQDSSRRNDYYVEFALEEWATETDSDPDLFSTYTAFGQGTWNETVKRDMADGGINQDTMPHKLTRKIDTTGAVTGTVDKIYFEWEPIEWLTRTAGDEFTNKTPSFVGNTINDVFVVQNRLGFLSQTEVSLSESGVFENFWRTTVLSTSPEDRIDFSASDLDGDLLQHAIPFDRQLLVFSELGQAAVFGDPVITLDTIQAPQISSYRCFKDVKPVSSGRSLFFGHSAGQFATIREYVPGTDRETFEDAEITLPVPRLIPNDVIRMTAGSVSQMLAVLTGSRDTIYLYQYLRTGQEQLQAAWATWNLTGTIEDIVFLEDRLMVLVTRDGVTHLEQIDLGPGRADGNEDFVIRADSQATLTFDSYDVGTDLSLFTTPIGWTFTANEPLVAVITAGTGETFGSVVTIDSRVVGTRAINLSGNMTGKTVLIGRPYEASVVLSKPLAKSQSGAALMGANQLVRRLRVYLEDTGYLKSTVEYVDADESEEEFLDTLVDIGDFYPGLLRSGEFEVGIHTGIEDFRVTLSSDAVLPFNLITGSWDIRVETKHPVI